jgi:flagellar motility protein MotE (MotC chaperone)
MIATRRRPQRFNFGRFVLPIAAILALAFALVFPPSHKLIFDGPLAPVWRTLGSGMQAASQPLSFAAQNGAIADRNREIRRLNAALEDQRKQTASRDAQIDDLKGQVQRLAAQPAPTAVPLRAAAKPAASGAPGVGAAAAGAPASGGADDDVARTAKVWTSMDADKAAAIARKLPDAYVVSVLAQMPADSAGDLLAALPADVAARLTAAGAGTR